MMWSYNLPLLLGRFIFVGLARGEEEENHTFVISLREAESGKALLDQIYEKAQNLGFDFGSLIRSKEQEANFVASPQAGEKNLSESNLAGQEDSTSGPVLNLINESLLSEMSESVNGASLSEDAGITQNAAGGGEAKKSKGGGDGGILGKGGDKGGASKKDSKPDQKTLGGLFGKKDPKKGEQGKKGGLFGKKDDKKSGGDDKKKRGGLFGRREPKKSAGDDKKKDGQKGKGFPGRRSKGAGAASKDKEKKTAEGKGKSADHEGKSKTADHEGKSKTADHASKGEKSASETGKAASATAESAKSEAMSKTAESAKSESMSKTAESASAMPSTMSSSMSMPSTMSSTMSVPASIMSMSDSVASVSPSVQTASATFSKFEAIKGADPDKVKRVLASCKDCKRVQGVLAYKEGDKWKDYSGKIELEMRDGKLCDKSGAISAMECGCKKEEIPQMGNMGETGLIHDKKISKEEIHQQANFMSQVAAETPSQAQGGGGEPTSVPPSVPGEGTPPPKTGEAGGSEGGSGGEAGGSAGGAPTSSAGGAPTSSAGGAPGGASPGGAPGGGAAAPQSSAAQSPAPTQPSPQPTPKEVPPTAQMPVVFKAIKLKYDLAGDDEKSPCTPSKARVPEFKTQTITVMDGTPQPTTTVIKTVRMRRKPKTVTVTMKAEEEKPECPPAIQVKKKKPARKPKPKKPDTEIEESEEKEDCPPKKKEEVVTVSKTVTLPYKGVECTPDCQCEEEGECDNPCTDLKCELV